MELKIVRNREAKDEEEKGVKKWVICRKCSGRRN
jgi:hypothetical protein